jgi:hypothetical protein
LVATALLALASSFAADPSLILNTSRWVISGEGTVAHFGARLNDRGIQAWNLSARFSLLSFGVTRFHFAKGILDGALEVGLEPTFERFSVLHQSSLATQPTHPVFGADFVTGGAQTLNPPTGGAQSIINPPPSRQFLLCTPVRPGFNPYATFLKRFPKGSACSLRSIAGATSVAASPFSTAGFANFGGLGLVLRYYFVHFRYGPLVPWIEAGIAPGGTDLKIGKVSNETRLTGDFMNRIKGGIGVSYFISENAAAYVGLQAQHLSNAGLNGSNRNYSLNTPTSFAIGASWFLR